MQQRARDDMNTLFSLHLLGILLNFIGKQMTEQCTPSSSPAPAPSHSHSHPHSPAAIHPHHQSTTGGGGSSSTRSSSNSRDERSVPFNISSITLPTLQSNSYPSFMSSSTNSRTFTNAKYDPTNGYSDNKCIVLDEMGEKTICDETERGLSREEVLSTYRLGSCPAYTVLNALSNANWYRLIHENELECHSVLQELRELDHFVASLLHQFASLLSRYNCASNYSVLWTCQQCQVSLSHLL